MSAQAPDLHVSGLESRVTLGLGAVERRLLDAVSPSRNLTDELTHHLVVADGRRMCPLFTLVCAQLSESEYGLDGQVITAATVVKLTRLASLYHDDVMDSAPTRRGVPSAQHLRGNNRVIPAGDVLFTHASLLVASLGPEMVAYHARTLERSCEGQLNETLGPTDGADRVDFYLQVLTDKTGSLVSTVVPSGTLPSGVGQLIASVASGSGEKAGVTLQIADDTLDLASSGEQSDKTPGTDLYEGVDTLLVLLLRRHEAASTIDEAGARILHELMGNLSLDEVLASAVEQLRSHDVLEETRELARTWANDAAAAPAPLPKGETKTTLEVFTNLMVDRPI